MLCTQACSEFPAHQQLSGRSHGLVLFGRTHPGVVESPSQQAQDVVFHIFKLVSSCQSVTQHPPLSILWLEEFMEAHLPSVPSMLRACSSIPQSSPPFQPHAAPCFKRHCSILALLLIPLHTHTPLTFSWHRNADKQASNRKREASNHHNYHNADKQPSKQVKKKSMRITFVLLLFR